MKLLDLISYSKKEIEMSKLLFTSSKTPHSIGYFYYDQNIKKKLLSGSQAGIFFIQNT